MSDDQAAETIDLGISGIRDATLIERGGFASVYAATDTDFDRRIAVKVLHGSNRSRLDRFASERLLLGRVSGHPSIVTVFRNGTTDGGDQFLLMELIEGGSLQDLLDRQGRLPWTEAVIHALTICEALEYVHGQDPPIIHNDIKPSNVLLQDGRAKLADFGIATTQDTTTSYAAGSLHYSPPEMWTDGRDTRDHRSDIYSLAATLYALIAGREPFQVDGPDSEPAQRTRIEQQIPDRLPPELCPAGLADWIALGLSKRPGDRPQRAGQFAEGLQRVLDSADPNRATNGAAEAESKHWLERPMMLGVLAVCTVIGGLTSILTITSNSDDGSDRPGLDPSGAGLAVTASTAADASAAAGSAAGGLGNDALPGAGVTVIAGRSSIDEGYFQAALLTELLTELGYEVSDPADGWWEFDEVYPVLAEGEIDFWPHGRSPGHEHRLAQSRLDGTTVGEHVVLVGDLIPVGGVFGLLITRLTARDHGIRSLQQINESPDLVELFDSDGNGKAEIYGCPVQHQCSTVIDETVAFNRWTNLEQIYGDVGQVTADSASAEAAGIPRIQYKWAPSEHTALLVPGQNVVWLSLGTEDNVIDGSTPVGRNYRLTGPAPLGERCTDDPCWLGWSWDTIRVAANRDFIEANPAAARLFELVTLDGAVVAQQIYNTFYEPSELGDPQTQAREWLAEHRELADGWLTEARLAAP